MISDAPWGDRRRRLGGRRRQVGQSLLELVITLFAFFTIFFMYVQVSLSMGVANFIQYATFMAARSFVSGWQDQRRQTLAAEGVIERMLKSGGGERFRGIIQDGEAAIGPSPRARPSSPDARKTSWEQGVTYKFKIRFYMVPLIRGLSGDKASQMELESQSWLGREPTEDECVTFMETTGPGRAGIRNAFVYDNGC